MKDCPKHSLLAVLSTEETKYRQPQLADYLRLGIKLLLFTEIEEAELSDEILSFKKSRQLQLFKVNLSGGSHYSSLYIVDGRMDDAQNESLRQLGQACLNFNEEQYRVEHVASTTHLCVEAGAGTGKTTVMIQRIFFLIHTAQIPLSEIVMITFTREAAQNMFHKLRQAFYERYELTGAVKYLTYIEELRMMRISTIHSFARTLIQDLGTELGYGQNVQIRNLRLERKRIIEHQINEKAQEWIGTFSLLDKFKNIPLYRIISTIDSFWTEMERKGLTRDEISHLQWGEAYGNNADLHELFMEVLPRCESDFEQFKHENNAVTLSDLTRQVEYASRRQDAFQSMSRRISHLFIDEFQDTDDSQIKLAARLVQALKARLFVVGDIKQSIYRFRGADYTAFESLKQLMVQQQEPVITLPLRKNYRSTEELLQEMDRHFAAWGGMNLLEYDQPLIGMDSDSNSALIINRTSFKKYTDEQRDYTLDLISRAKDTIRDPKKQKTALLVRTNGQAWRLKKWCDKAGINAHLEIGGTFFTSPAVKEFTYLIDALLYPGRPAEVLNLLNSSYSKIHVHWSMLPQMDGSEEAIAAFLQTVMPFDGFQELRMKILVSPLLAVIREIMEISRPASRYHHDQLEILETERPLNPENAAEAMVRASQYQKNINHLMELLHQQFSTDFLTLYGLSSWLKLNMAVNRDEDEPELEEDELGTRIRIMTVHKSKGLEFHTVILPFTEQDFRFDRSELLLDQTEGSWRAGWQVKEGSNFFQNEPYNELTANETQEVEKEESRLLYVAMTRCEKHLWIIRNVKYNSRDNWCRLLSM